MNKSPTLVAMTMNTDIPSLEKTFLNKFRILRLTINVLMPAGNAAKVNILYIKKSTSPTYNM